LTAEAASIAFIARLKSLRKTTYGFPTDHGMRCLGVGGEREVGEKVGKTTAEHRLADRRNSEGDEDDEPVIASDSPDMPFPREIPQCVVDLFRCRGDAF
jgi:hypothetical protein